MYHVYRVFEKGGVMTALGEYVAEANSKPAPASRKPASASNRLGPQISSSNVGYQLLQKAGWQEGQGIGINQQGRPIPLSGYHQQARHGIGADDKPANAAHVQRKTSSKRKADSSSGHADSMRQVKQNEQQPVPDVPEDPNVRKQRHQQVCHLKPSLSWHHLHPSFVCSGTRFMLETLLSWRHLHQSFVCIGTAAVVMLAYQAESLPYVALSCSVRPVHVEPQMWVIARLTLCVLCRFCKLKQMRLLEGQYNNTCIEHSMT